MADEPKAAFFTHAALVVTGLTACGVAVCASGGLAVIGVAVAAGCLLATAMPETSSFDREGKCLADLLDQVPKEQDDPVHEIETGTHWQAMVIARQTGQELSRDRAA